MDYPHHLLAERETGGTSDGMGGTQPGTEATKTVYDGEADVQEQAKTYFQARDGQVKEGDARVFLPASVGDFQPGDSVTITWEDGRAQEAAVKEVRHLDDSLTLAYA